MVLKVWPWSNKAGSKPTTREAGKYWEQVARDYLIRQGLVLIEENFHCRFGEIDLIMSDNETLVFIEVKYRKGQQYGGAIATISKNKQQKIAKTASIYLQQHQLNEYNTPYRFDVIAIDNQANEKSQPHINWLTNAFN